MVTKDENISKLSSSENEACKSSQNLPNINTINFNNPQSNNFNASNRVGVSIGGTEYDGNYLQILAYIRKLEQDILQTKTKLKKMESLQEENELLKEEILRIKQYNIQLEKNMSYKIEKVILKNNLINKIFTEKKFLTVEKDIFSILVVDDKNFVIGGESNYLASYSILNPKSEFRYNPRSEKNKYSITSLCNINIPNVKEKTYFLSLEYYVKVEQKIKMAILHIEKKHHFISKIHLRKLNEANIIKEIQFIDASITGKINKILSFNNYIFFDFFPNNDYKTVRDSNSEVSYSSADLEEKNIRIYQYEVTQKILAKDSYGIQDVFFDIDPKLKEINDFSILGNYSDNQNPNYELAIALKNYVLFIYNNTSYSVNNTGSRYYDLNEGDSSSNEISSICFTKESTCATSHGCKPNIIIWELFPILTKLKVISFKSSIISMKRVDYLESIIIVGSHQTSMLIKETVKTIATDLEKVDIIDYEEDNNQLKIIGVKGKNSIRCFI